MKKDQFEETPSKEVVKKPGKGLEESLEVLEDRYYERLKKQLMKNQFLDDLRTLTRDENGHFVAYENEKDKKLKEEDKLKIASLEKRVLELELAIDRLARATDGNNWAGVPRYRDQKRENEKKDKKQENKS